MIDAIRHKLVWTLGFATALTFLSGCGIEVENWVTYFQESRFVRYEEPEVVAVGAEVELTYFRKSHTTGRPTSGPVELDSVTSSNPEVIRVVDFSRADPPYSDLVPGRIVLEAVGEGSASIHVVDGSGDELSFTMHAAEAVELRFGENPCVNGDQPPMVGQRIPIFYDLFDRRGRKLYKYYMPTPSYTVDPPGALAGNEAQGPAGTVTLKSTIDDTQLEFEVIDDEHIEDAILTFGGEPPTVNYPGQSASLVLKGTTASGGDICESAALNTLVDVQAQELTPEVCTSRFVRQLHPFYFRFESPGTCRIRYDLPRANGGSGITLTPEFEVVPRP